MTIHAKLVIEDQETEYRTFNTRGEYLDWVLDSWLSLKPTGTHAQVFINRGDTPEFELSFETETEVIEPNSYTGLGH